MPNETTTNNLGPYGHVLTNISGTGVVTTSNQDTTRNQRDSSTFRSYTTGHKQPGWLYPKPYVRSSSHRNDGYGVWQHRRYPQSTSAAIINDAKRVGVISGYATHLNTGELPPVSSTLQSRAEVKALLNLKDQKVNLAQAYAERKMTADLVASSLNRIARSLLLLRQRKLREAWRLLAHSRRPSTLPRSWLEYQYGWRPLLGDIHGSIQALQDNRSSHDWVVTVKGSARDNSNVEELIGGTYAVVRKTVKENGCFVRLDYVPDNNFLATLGSLGLTNPYALAWELLPFSFVLDWALPIGDWLSAMDADNGFDFLSGSRSVRRMTKTTLKAVNHQYPLEPTYRMVQTDYSAFRREFDLQRTIYSSSPVPTYPGFKDPTSVVHVANALSLLAQALAGKRPNVW